MFPAKRWCGWPQSCSCSEKGGISMRIFSLIAAMLVALGATAQPVFESRDKAGGAVFSDTPSSGASEVVLPPVNLMKSPPVPVATPPAPPPVYLPYTAISIVDPEDGGTVHSNDGQISMQVAISPALQRDRGDAIAVKLDGNLLPDRRLTVNFDITPSDWQLSASTNIEHQLEVAVVDAAGEALLVSSPIHIFVHRASFNTSIR